MTAFKIPEGWTLEPYSARVKYLEDYYVLNTSTHPVLSMTLDFKHRALRDGISISGPIVGAKHTRKGYFRPTYTGRNWKQKMVDEAVKHLRQIQEG